MTTYITQEQAVDIGYEKLSDTAYGAASAEQLHAFANAAIQAYRDSLVAGVVLPQFSDSQITYAAKEAGFNLQPTENMLFTVRGGHAQLCNFAKTVGRQAIADALIVEKQAAWDAVNQFIKPGDLGGNGCDNNAQRNGLILAANLLRVRMAAAPDPKDGA